MTPIRDRLRAWAIQQRVPFLDMTPHYRKAVGAGARLNYRLDEHLNVEGNQFTAAAIADWLRQIPEFSVLVSSVVS